jgi:predicted nucleotidyltransferase
MFNPDFKEFVELLVKNQVEYLVVGGYAVSIHGYPRYTGDLDIWINPTQNNAEKVLSCINEFGFSSFELTDKDFTKEYGIVQLGYPPVRIDIINSIDGVNFEECFQKKSIINIDDLSVNFISLEDLITNKKNTARPRDIDDVENLSK